MQSYHPLLIPLLFFSSGVAAGFNFNFKFGIWDLSAIAIVLAFASFTGKGVRLLPVLLGIFWFAGGYISIWPLNNNFHGPSINLNTGEHCILEGIVSGRPNILPEGYRFEFEASHKVLQDGSKIELKGKFLVTLSSGCSHILRGDRVRFSGTFWIPRALGLPGEFDYAAYLALRGIKATVRVPDNSRIAVIRVAEKDSILRKLDILAFNYDSAVRNIINDKSVAPILIAMVTGSQSEIPPEIKSIYARSGVLHILSISGFHVAIIAGVFVQILYLMFIRWEWLALRINLRRAAMLAALPVMATYLFFTGAAPATARSVIMMAAVVAALSTERESNPLDSLFFAAMMLLLINPPILFDPGFQLSFMSLWGIVVITPLLLSPFDSKLKPVWRKFTILGASSAAASIATAVPSLAEFHQASITAVIANIIVIPLLGYGALLLGTVALPVVCFLPSLSSLLILPAGWIIELSNRIISFFAEIPVFRSYQIGKLDILVSVSLLVAFSIFKSRRRIIISIVTVITFTILLHTVTKEKQSSGLEMVFFSVGQGESFLVRFPDKSNMLVDGGGYLYDNGRDFGEKYLVPALYAIGVDRVDRLLLTHPHPDHLGGLPAVAENFKIGEFIQGNWSTDSMDYQRLKKALAKKNVPVKTISPGNRFLFSAGGAVVNSLTPDLSEDTLEHSGDNDDSLVLRIQYKTFSALLMGDAGHVVENELLENGLKEATLLKVGHHGSKTASGERFIKVLKPQLALVSAGYGNRFRLPSAETLERFKKYKVNIFRTDLDGTVTFKSDGFSWQAVRHIHPPE